MLKIKEQLIESLKGADVVKVKKHFNDLMEEFSATVIDQYRKHIASKFLVEGEEEIEDEEIEDEEIEKTEIEEGINPKKSEPKDPKVGKKVTEEDEEINPNEDEEEITESHKLVSNAFKILLKEEDDDEDKVANHVNDDTDPEKEDDKNKKKRATKKDGEE